MLVINKETTMDDDTVHVEIVLRKQSRESSEGVREIVAAYLADLGQITPGSSLCGDRLPSKIAAHVESITVGLPGEFNSSSGPIVWSNTTSVLHVLRLDEFGPEIEDAASLRSLPARELHGLWESLAYDSRVKADALAYSTTVLRLAACGVDPHLVACNRVLLLHGPPGTGKTSLCRALAHKLAVRLVDTYPRAVLVEVDAPGLFSKWFSESGKLIAKLFTRVRELLADPGLLVLVLLDEAESLAHVRSARGSEPSDALRAVNAALTQLDLLRAYGNVLLLATSNLPDAMDAAFLDRADLRLHIGPPGKAAALLVLNSGTEELMRTGTVSRQVINEGAMGLRLADLAMRAATEGVSGRTLRRLPLLALSRVRVRWGKSGVAFEEYVSALEAVLDNMTTKKES